MFGFIKRLFRRRSNRLIYQYNDGVSVRYADPIALSTAIANHPDYLRRHLVEAMDGDSVALDVVQRTVCDVFGAKPLDPATGKGLTQAEALELLLNFESYAEQLKKNIGLSSSSRRSSDATQPA